MSKNAASYILPALFLLSIPVAVLGGGAWFLHKHYGEQKATLIREIEAIPKFDSEAEARKLAAELKLNYPPTATAEPLENIRKRLDDACKKKAREKFSAKELSAATIEALRKLSQAKIGDKVLFQLERTNETITGIYRGKEDQGKGPIIIIDNGAAELRYPLTRIMKEYHPLFNEGASEVAQDRIVESIKKSFDERRDAYAGQLYASEEPKLLSEAGYLRNESGNWVSGAELLDAAVTKLREAYDQKYPQEVRTLIEKRRFLRLFEISIPEELKAPPGAKDAKNAK